MKDAVAKGWAHLDITSTSPGHLSVYSQDSGPTAGQQMITVDGSHAEVMLINKVAYVRGDATAVASFFGFPASLVPRLTNQWISFVPTDSAYATVIDAVTLASALDEATITGPFTMGAATVIGGVHAVAVDGELAQADGGASARGLLYISTGSDPLPLQLDLTASDGSTGTIKFSAWGVAVPLVAPSGVIPASSLVASSSA